MDDDPQLTNFRDRLRGQATCIWKDRITTEKSETVMISPLSCRDFRCTESGCYPITASPLQESLNVLDLDAHFITSLHTTYSLQCLDCLDFYRSIRYCLDIV